MKTVKTGSRGVSCQVLNEWSDEAREAAQRARAGHMPGGDKTESLSSDAHAASKKAYAEGTGHTDAKRAHIAAGDAHTAAAESAKEAKDSSGEMKHREAADAHYAAAEKHRKELLKKVIHNSSLEYLKKASEKPEDDPIKAAREYQSSKSDEADKAMAEADRLEAVTKAQQARDEATTRSKLAFKQKPGTPKHSMAHTTAAMAHQDAASHFKKLSGGGNNAHDLESRANAKKMGDEHTAHAERHSAIAEGKPDPAKAFGNIGKGGKIRNSQENDMDNVRTGSRNVVCNTWSDAARQADINKGINSSYDKEQVSYQKSHAESVKIK